MSCMGMYKIDVFLFNEFGNLLQTGVLKLGIINERVACLTNEVNVNITPEVF